MGWNNIKRCSDCGAGSPEEASSCVRCGSTALLSPRDPDANTAPEWQKCRACGRSQKGRGDRCGYCQCEELEAVTSETEVNSSITEEPIPDDILGPIKGCALDALKVLGQELAAADPTRIVEAVDEFAYRWQKGLRPPASIVEDGEEARLILGSLWGEQLVKEFGWQWAKVTFHDYGDSIAFGVFAPDRSLAIYPLEFMLGALRDPGVDVTVMLSFNMLKAGKCLKMPARSYTNVMECVHRIVPRIAAWDLD